MSNSVRPHRQQPTRLPHPWDSPGKNTGVGFHFLLQCMKVKSESEVTQSCPTQAPPSMGFSRQESWSGVPLPSPSCMLRQLNFPSSTVPTPKFCSFFQLALSTEDGFQARAPSNVCLRCMQTYLLLDIHCCIQNLVA